MKLYFMKEDALIYFKNNIEANMNYYLKKDNSWVFNKYYEYKNKEVSPFEEFKLEVNDLKLDVSEDIPAKTDFTNVKILYSALRALSNAQARDERFWIGLSHGYLWDYMLYRSDLNENNINSNKILNQYFITNKRSFITNTISRLWWTGKFIYNENLNNPFEALEYMKTDFPTKVLILFSQNFTNNPKITCSILKAFMDLEKNGEIIKREKVIKILSYLNILGGVIILDYLSEDEIKNKIINFYYKEIKKN